MGGKRAIAIALAACACAGVAIVFATGGISGARTVAPGSGPAPRCLPASLNGGALLRGTRVSVSPAPSTDSASPGTQISFLGVPAGDVSNVAVDGSRSGYHYGQLRGYLQGDGGSFVPYKPFAPGEQVSVRALIGAPGHAQPVSYDFAIATPYPMDRLPGFPNPAAPPSSVQSFVSAPSLHPPILDVTTPDRDPAAGAVMMTVGPGPGQYGPLIFRPDGTLVWFAPLPAGTAALDLHVQRYAGQDVLTWWQGKVLAMGFGQGADIVMDSSYRTVGTIRAGNGYQADLHDFQIVAGKVAYLTVYDLIRCDLSAIGGARNGVLVDTAVQAVDMDTGLVRWEWHSLDHIGAGESHAPVTQGAVPWDFFHLNSIDPQADGNVLISARSTWAAYELDGRSGAILWRLGGTRSSFAPGPGTEMAWQHDARMQADGTVTLFDNGSLPRVHAQSRGLRIALDTRRRTVSLVRAYTHPQTPLLADSQGNMQTLADGRVVIGWGAIPSVSEFSPAGALLFDAHMPPATSSYRAFRFPWSGHPLSAPSVSARVLATDDQTAVYVSWNGASDVATWRVLAGPDPSSLSAQATAPDAAFESTITYADKFEAHKVEYVAVQALDANGVLLGTSPTVAVAPPQG